MYISGRVDIFDMVDIDLFTMVALNMMVLKLGYTGKSEPMFYNYFKPLTSLDEGLYALACEEDVRCLGNLVRSFKLIGVYIEHGVTALDSYLRAPLFKATLEEITDEPGSIAANRTEKMCMPDCILTPSTNESVITYTQLSGVQGVDTQSHVIDNVMMQLSFDETELDGEAGFADVEGSSVDSSGLKISTQEPIVAEVSTKVPIVEEVGTQKFSVEDVVLENYVSSGEDREDAEQGIDTAYETKYDVQSSEDAGTNDDDDVGEDFLVDEENEILEPDVDVYLFSISMDLPFDNIGVINLVPDDVLEGENVDVINADGYDSDPGNDKFTTPKEAKDRVYLHSIESRRNLKLYENDGIRIRARCDGKVPVFTMSQGTGPTDPNHKMEAGPSGSNDPTTRRKKRKNAGTNDHSQASPSFLDAYDKGDLCLWVLYVGKDKFTQNWVVKTHNDTHTCLQSREIKHCTYKFLSENIFEQVRVNPDLQVRAVQD
ncbi:hypothetical protein Tco_0491764 [Tanacetum coccineum]